MKQAQQETAIRMIIREIAELANKVIDSIQANPSNPPEEAEKRIRGVLKCCLIILAFIEPEDDEAVREQIGKVGKMHEGEVEKSIYQFLEGMKSPQELLSDVRKIIDSIHVKE